MNTAHVDDATIGVHIIGAGFGESIILQLPDGTFGVIDCCCSRLQAKNAAERLAFNPTLRLLVNELRAESLAFLAVTHPHEDHARGISHILEHYQARIKQIWIFQTFQDIFLQSFFRALVDKKRRFPIEKLLNQPCGTFYRELARLRNLAQRQCYKGPREKRAHLECFYNYQAIELAAGRIRIHFLGPRARRIEKYRATLVENTCSLLDDKRLNVNAEWEPKNVRHNEVSPAFLVEFGETRLILGGDMEDEAWQDVIHEQDENSNRPNLQCDFLKVSHHGSRNGICDRLIATFSADGPPLAALTPFNRHGSPLPNLEGLAEYRQHLDELLVTNVEQVKKAIATTMPPESYTYADKLWASVIKRNPSWAGAVDSSLLDGDSVVAPFDSLPGELAALLRKNPALANGLRSDLKQELPSSKSLQQAEHKHRLSFFFDSLGNELKQRRYVGSGAGALWTLG